uniref:Uncharacterized protein n=1 Tax=Strigamia maritima TaxID=126957 RepID=T1IKS5_STRMM
MKDTSDEEETPRKRIKLGLAKKQEYDVEDDSFFTEEVLSQFDAAVNDYYAKENKSLLGNLLTTKIKVDVVAPISLTVPSQSVETPVVGKENHEEDEAKLYAELEEKQEQVKIIIKQKNLAQAELKIVKERNRVLQKTRNDEINAKTELIESYERALKEIDGNSKYTKKIKDLEEELSLKQHELTQLHEKYDQLLSERQQVTSTCESDNGVDETSLALCRGEMTILQFIPHLIYGGDGVFIFIREENSYSNKQSSPDNSYDDIDVIPSSLNTASSDVIEFMELDTSTSSEISCENSWLDLKYNLIHTFLTNTNFDNANIKDVLVLLLRILQEKLNSYVEPLQRTLQLNISLNSSCESLFGHSSSNSSASSIAPMTQVQFDEIERELLLVLNFLWKIINTEPKILEELNTRSRMVVDNSPETTPIHLLTYQLNGDLVNYANSDGTLWDNLVTLIQIQRTCDDQFTRKCSKEIVILVLRVLAATVAVNDPLRTEHRLLRNYDNNSCGIILCLDIGVGIDVVNVSLDLLDGCVRHFEGLDWMCDRGSKRCYISCVSSLCESLVKSSYCDDVKLQLLGKILNQLIFALCTEANKCETSIDEHRLQVLSNGIQFVQWFSLVDPQFQDRSRNMIHFIHSTNLFQNWTNDHSS